MTVDYFKYLKENNDDDLYFYATKAMCLYSFQFYIAVPNVVRFWLEAILKKICELNGENYIVANDAYQRIDVDKTIKYILQLYLNNKDLKRYLRQCQKKTNEGSHNNVEIYYMDKDFKDCAQVSLSYMYDLYKWYCQTFYNISIVSSFKYPEKTDIDDILKRYEELTEQYDALEKENIELSKNSKTTPKKEITNKEHLSELDIWEINHQNKRLSSLNKELKIKIEKLESEIKILEDKIPEYEYNERDIQEIILENTKFKNQIENLQAENQKNIKIIDKLKIDLEKISAIPKIDLVEKVSVLESKIQSQNIEKKDLILHISILKEEKKRVLEECYVLKQKIKSTKSNTPEDYESINTNCILLKEKVEELNKEILSIRQYYTNNENDLREQLCRANEKIQQLQQNKNEYGIDNKVIAKNGAEKLQLAYENASKDKDIKMHLYDDVLTTIRMMTKRKSNIYITRNTIKIFLTGDTSANQVKYFQLDKLNGFGKYQDKYIEAIDIENILYYLEDGEILQNNDGFYKLLVN